MQGQMEQKVKEHEERELVSQQTIISLKEEMDRLAQRLEADQQKMPVSRASMT